MEFCSKTRAKLVIRERNCLVKKYLLNADMSVNDVVSRAKNLKDTDIKPGGVYAEKSGTEYLYLGHVDYDFSHSQSDHYIYIRYTKKVQSLVEEAKKSGITTVNDFNIKVLLPDIDKFTFSRRDNARKFVKEVKKYLIKSYAAGIVSRLFLYKLQIHHIINETTAKYIQRKE